MKKFIRKNLVIMLIIFFSAAIIVISGVLLWNAYKEYGDGFKYFEQGIVITLAVGGGCVSLVSALIQNRKSIDADVKAKSRIEWIQRVREATAEFVTACYMVIGKDQINNDELDGKYTTIREKGYLLKLYFGNDTKENQCVKKCPKKDCPKILIKCEKTNDGKNELINEYIDDINAYFFGDRYLKANNVALEKLLYAVAQKLNMSKVDLEDRLENDSINEDDIKDKGGEKLEDLKEYKECLNVYKQLKKDVENELEELVNVIRLYLKIEWDRAKDNKD